MNETDPEIRAKRAERRATKANRRADEAERALAVMRARAEGAETARDEARAALEPLREEVGRLSDPEMRDLRLADGGINLQIAGPMVERLAVGLAGYVRGDGTGPGNYAEMHVHSRTAPFERYTVTVQRSDRPSPHELRVEAERARDQARTELQATRDELVRDQEALRERIRTLGDQVCDLGLLTQEIAMTHACLDGLGAVRERNGATLTLHGRLSNYLLEKLEAQEAEPAGGRF